MIYLTSDTHFCHDREFIYKPRGFNSIEEMNEGLLENWNSVVSKVDTVYVLGDFFLGADYNKIKEILYSLNGHIVLIVGNHDTPAKIDFYAAHSNKIEFIFPAMYYKSAKRKFYLSHFPTLTSSLEQNPKYAIFNLFGHTHSKEKFYEGRPFMYNVSVDANDNTPVSIDEINERIREEIEKCKSFLV